MTKLFSRPDVSFFPTGSTLLDLALGGGWALGRIFNIVGDKSTGKTLLAVEAFANFHITYPKGRMRYAEAEAAFDESFAEVLGFPQEVERPEKLLRTVEEFTDDLYRFCEKEGPSLYIVDSLDALSNSSEIQRFNDRLEGKKEKGSMGAEKAKELSETFRLLNKDLGERSCSLGIISQVRDNIGVMFGETTTRSGGRALDFYATHALYLHESGKLERQIKNQKITTGVSIRSKVKKNKVSVPFREASYDIVFSYGIDDHSSMIDYLKKVGCLEKKKEEKKSGVIVQPAVDEELDLRTLLEDIKQHADYSRLKEFGVVLKSRVIKEWEEIEDKASPTMRKYGEATLSEMGGKSVQLSAAAAKGTV